MTWLVECIYCGHFLYHLNDGRIKCSLCHKKNSKEKINKTITLIYAFINNESALYVSKRLNISYISTSKYYKTFRELCAKISEDEYEKVRGLKCEYEEYFYLESSKKQKDAVFDAYNFLTFDYENHIYTIMMPSLRKYKHQFLEDNVEDAYIDEFSKFKRDAKLIKVSNYFNNIVQFWEYFEKSILIYKGINVQSFAYFLKEFEFKYNHTKDEAIELLIKSYFKST